MSKKEPCEWYAATQKHGKYDASFVGTDYFFGAMVFETLGAINAEGEEILKQLFRFASKRLGRLLRIVVVLGREYRVICSAQFRKQLCRVLMVKSFVM